MFSQIHVYSQEGFRGLNWGSTTSQLKFQDLSLEYDIQRKGDITHYFISGLLSSIDVLIDYVFLEDKLYCGMYFIQPENNFYTSGEALNDYHIISMNLKKRYTMWDDYTWYNTSLKDDLELSLSQGFVDLKERCTRESDMTVIHHELYKRNTTISHLLWYYSPQFVLEVLSGNGSTEY
jgi:hypothetical protein